MSTALLDAPAPPALLTAEEYARRPDQGRPEELVRGRIVPMGLPNRRHGQICNKAGRIFGNCRHGQICNKAGRIFGNFAEDRDLGHLLSNDAGVITERDPDTVRGADVAFYSYARLPKGPLPANYGPEVPELVVEVRSPSDRWPNVQAKVAEYLGAGVRTVIVLDDESRSALLYFDERTPDVLKGDDELTLPDLLPEFRVSLARFFE